MGVSCECYANGKLTLVGEWTAEAVNAFAPVLKNWDFFETGTDFGLYLGGELSPHKFTYDFSGRGHDRIWYFSDLLEQFDTLTRALISGDLLYGGEPAVPLSAEQYNLLLTLMHDNDLSIELEFNEEMNSDAEVGLFAAHEKGTFTSTGENLVFTLISCEDVERTWDVLEEADLNAAVEYFLHFVDKADKVKIRKWVYETVPPFNCFEEAKDYLDVLVQSGALTEEVLESFMEEFSPDTDAWENLLTQCRDEYDWFAPPKPNFWDEHSEDELEVDLETGQISFRIETDRSVHKQSAVIIEHDDLKKRYHWRDEFPFNIAHWRDVKQIAVGRDIVTWLKTDGLVFTAHYCGYISKHSIWGVKALAVAAGWENSATLYEDGTMEDSINGTYNFRLPYGPDSAWKHLTAVAAGAYHLVGLKKKHTVVAAGNNQYGQCNVNDWRDITAIAAGGAITVGLKKDGTVIVLAPDGDSDAFETDGWKDIAAIDAGEQFVVGLTRNGTVLASGIMPDEFFDIAWQDITAIAAGGWHILGLKRDGTVAALGKNNMGQCDVEEWRDIVSVAAGHAFSFGIKSDGTVVVAGKYFDPNAKDKTEDE